MPDSAQETLRALLQAPACLLADVDRDDPSPGPRALVRCDAPGTMQLHEWADGALTQLTHLPEPVGAARYLPGGEACLLEVDAGGNERSGLHRLDLAAARHSPVRDVAGLAPIAADPAFIHHLAGISPDGSTIAYTSNRQNGVDFDLWLCDLDGTGHRLLHAAGTWLHPGSGFSPDGRHVSVIAAGRRPLDTDLILVEVATGTARTVLPHPGEAALVDAPAWTGPDTLVTTTNAGGEFSLPVGHRLTTDATTPLPDPPPGDSEVRASRNGSTLLVLHNAGGANLLELRDPATGTRTHTVKLPEPGVVSSYAVAAPILTADGEQVLFTLTTPRLPGDVFRFDRASGRTERLTHSAAELDALALSAAETHDIASFDGESIPVFVFRPTRETEGPPPAVLIVHGGPESQATLSFNPIVQGLAAAGYGVVVPNVRGSTGYGRRYAALDDTVRRLDSVEDLRAIHDALPALGLDPARAALWGGSYGGYMVLAGLAFQPDLWAAGVDIVGISDLVTFLENTSPYRRAFREVEYGSLAHDRAFLASASPLRRADAIRAPLFVIHGRNDPRVPVAEAEQLVANLRDRGVPCTLRIYEDEGHGLARRENRLDAYPAAIAFLDGVLQP